MMQELMIVNPSRRPSKRRKSTKTASPAQKRARAAFAAMARGRRKNPTKRRKVSAKRRSTAVSVLHTPKRKATRSRRRRNPIALKGMLGKPMAYLTPALMGAVGAIAVNNVLARLPLPPIMNTGKMRYVTQFGAALALATIAQKVGMKGATAAQMAEGSMVVTLRDAIIELASGAGMNLSGMGYYLPGRGVQAAPSRNANPGQLMGMGKYLTGPGSRSSNVMSMQGLARQGQRGKGGFGF